MSLLMALWPVGRLAMTGFEPTLEQLLRLRCAPGAGTRPRPALQAIDLELLAKQTQL
jgi:hypothetical protein